MGITRASQWLIRAAASPGPSKSVAYRLMRQGGFIARIDNGLFSLLPNGQRSVDRLQRIIEDELDDIGAQKVSYPILGPKTLWDRTDRWDKMGTELVKLRDRHDEEYCLQPTAEEMCTQSVLEMANVRKESMPILLYQTTEKFRDEAHPRYGLLRGRQFLMNDLYSFDLTQEKAVETYQKVSDAYDRILRKRLNLDVFKVRADSGVHGGRLSHEYHLRNPLNQDEIIYCHQCKTGGNAKTEGECQQHGSEKMSSVEIAHTFQLGTKYSEVFGLSIESAPLDMCCFGIGVTRLIHAAIEAMSPTDESALRLPAAIAPFDVAVVVHGKLLDHPFTASLLSDLQKKHKYILLDDRNETLGNRIRSLAHSGIPRYIVLGGKTVKSIDSQPTMELFVGEPMKSELTCLTKAATTNEIFQLLDSHRFL
ncbi:unnamed protein product, partial [Mesorhabditis spiculigera]